MSWFLPKHRRISAPEYSRATRHHKCEAQSAHQPAADDTAGLELLQAEQGQAGTGQELEQDSNRSAQEFSFLVPDVSNRILRNPPPPTSCFPSTIALSCRPTVNSRNYTHSLLAAGKQHRPAEIEMATSRDDDAGKFVVANATPFLWKQSEIKESGMSSWHFPKEVKPGETITATVAFQGGQDAHGEVSYQVRWPLYCGSSV